MQVQQWPGGGCLTSFSFCTCPLYFAWVFLSYLMPSHFIGIFSLGPCILFYFFRCLTPPWQQTRVKNIQFETTKQQDIEWRMVASSVPQRLNQQGICPCSVQIQMISELKKYLYTTHISNIYPPGCRYMQMYLTFGCTYWYVYTQILYGYNINDIILNAQHPVQYTYYIYTLYIIPILYIIYIIYPYIYNMPLYIIYTYLIYIYICDYTTQNIQQFQSFGNVSSLGETTLFRVVAMDTSGRVRDGTDDSMNSELGRKRLLVTLSHWDYPLVN